MSEIGNLIYNRRKELGLTLEEVGNAVGVSKSTVKKWENGFISNMRRDKNDLLTQKTRRNSYAKPKRTQNDSGGILQNSRNKQAY